MSRPSDYRTLPYSISCITDCGKYIGRGSYWKLYGIENLVRSIVHSVLCIQIGPEWLLNVINKEKQNLISKMKQTYARQPSGSSPGKHDVYYLYLSDLSKIIASHSHLFLQWIPDIDSWVLKLESIREPRNIIGHMNWLNHSDEHKIREVYLDFKSLQKKLLHKGLPMQIP